MFNITKDSSLELPRATEDATADLFLGEREMNEERVTAAEGLDLGFLIAAQHQRKGAPGSADDALTETLPLAMERVSQCVASSGGLSRVRVVQQSVHPPPTRTGLGTCHSLTGQPQQWATDLLDRPSPQLRTMCARRTNAWAIFGLRIQRAKIAQSESETCSGAKDR
jgi:hypothetical protein